MRASRLNELTKWSNLARLASGNLPKLTIVAPFIAFIILHNDPLQPLLELSEYRHSNAIIDYLSLARFDIFYLGLIVVGLGVAIFTVFCPKQVTGYATYETFIEQKERTKTANAVAGSFRLILERFLDDARADEPSLDEMGTSLRFPRRFHESLLALALSVFDRSGVDRSAYTDERGEVNAAELLGLMHRRDPASRGVWQGLYSALHQHSIDVYRLEYLTADYSAPHLRIFVFWTLVLGIAIMLVPTAITTVLVVADLFDAAAAVGGTATGPQ